MRNSAKLLLALSILALVSRRRCGPPSLHPTRAARRCTWARFRSSLGKAAGKATASLTVVCQADLTKGMLTIQANGLEPKGVYTVWLVKGAFAPASASRPIA